MGKTEYLSLSQREQILNAGVIPIDFVTASGEPATQKFEFDNIDSSSVLFQHVITGLARCIQDRFEGYDGILTVARGATRLGDPLSKVLEIDHLKSSYYSDEGNVKHFSVRPKQGIDKVVVVDDVFTRGTSSSKVALAAQEKDIETIGVAVILNRSETSDPAILGSVPVASVIHRTLE